MIQLIILILSLLGLLLHAYLTKHKDKFSRFDSLVFYFLAGIAFVSFVLLIFNPQT